MADDMRPQLGCYGQAEMKTPHLDKLAQEGLIFDRAYTQFAYCAPSRNSFMSGRRPERTRVLNFDTTFRKVHGDSWVTMPQYFKNAGYFTTAAGKLYHDGEDDAASWSHGLGNPLGSNQTHWIQCQCAKACIHNSQKRVTSRLQHTTNPVFAPRVCGQGDLCDNHSSTGVNYCGITPSSATQYTDEDLVLHEGLARLDAALASGKPWMVMMGVHRPHWRSRLPQGWWGHEVYPGTLAPPKWPLAPTDAPWMSGNWHGGDYQDPAHGCPNCSVPAVRSIECMRS